MVKRIEAKDDRPMLECPVCHKRYRQRRSEQVYCSDACRWKQWQWEHPRVKVLREGPPPYA